MKLPRASLRVDEVLEGRAISPDARVSSHSRFRDSLWDFTDARRVRLNSVPDARLRIDWRAYARKRHSAELPEAHTDASLSAPVIEELKAFAYLYLSMPDAFSRRGKRSIKPSTAIVLVRTLVNLVAVVQHNRAAAAGFDNFALDSLCDITLSDLRIAVAESEILQGDNLQKALRMVSEALVQPYLHGERLQWTRHDIKRLELPARTPRTDYRRVMPNELFRLLSNTACGDVVAFLKSIGIDPLDGTCTPTPLPFPGTTGEYFDDYLAIRAKDREWRERSGRRENASGPLRKAYLEKHRVKPADVQLLLYRVQRAAYTVLALYTGARYSDLTTFKRGCVDTLGGVPVIRGTHVKGESLTAEENRDTWPAIPIMRDALRCLEEVSRFTGNPYLISSAHTVDSTDAAEPLSLAGYVEAVTNYLHEIDATSRWKDWRISSHQLRHTLAHQLARADVGLLFIAHQLKHLHTALHSLPPEVTLMYGNVSQLAMDRALHSGQAHIEAATQLFSPDAPVAGGGAEEFQERRKAYFEGMAAAGWTTEEVIAQLAAQGIPFSSVGLGYCGGKRERRLKDGTRELPPCLGSLQCNPAKCGQAVITKNHAPQWRKVIFQNARLLEDGRMAYAKEHLSAASDTARQVLQQLGELPPSL